MLAPPSSVSSFQVLTHTHMHVESDRLPVLVLHELATLSQAVVRKMSNSIPPNLGVSGLLKTPPHFGVLEAPWFSFRTTKAGGSEPRGKKENLSRPYPSLDPTPDPPGVASKPPGLRCNAPQRLELGKLVKNSGFWVNESRCFSLWLQMGWPER